MPAKLAPAAERLSVPLTIPEVFHAVCTLVQDEVRPALGVLRNRVEKLSGRRVECGDIEALVAEHGIVSGLRLEVENRATYVGVDTRKPPFYVDPMDPSDPFPESVWAAFNREVGRATLAHQSWSGGRLGCATTIKARLEELESFSLGRVQHLVQLAVKRKILGYQGGQLAPYIFCEEARKKRGESTAKKEDREGPREIDETTLSFLEATPMAEPSLEDTPVTLPPPPKRIPTAPPRPPLPQMGDVAKFDELLADEHVPEKLKQRLASSAEAAERGVRRAAPEEVPVGDKSARRGEDNPEDTEDSDAFEDFDFDTIKQLTELTEMSTIMQDDTINQFQ